MTRKAAATPSVFISSTVEDLREYRQAAIEACLAVGTRPLTTESLPADDRSPLEATRQLLDRADIYLSIVAFRYGHVPEGQQKSLTELEYEWAGERGIPRLVFLMSNTASLPSHQTDKDENAAKLLEFKQQLMRTSLVAYFDSPDSLRSRITSSLLTYRSERSKPKRALVMIPHDAEHSDLLNLIDDTLHDLNLKIIRPEDMPQQTLWATSLADAIEGADIIITDITTANPNTFYELGFAHALRKPTILLIDTSKGTQPLPADLSGHRILGYNPREGESFKPRLARLLQAYVGSIAS